jgi:hypothetical protein
MRRSALVMWARRRFPRSGHSASNYFLFFPSTATKFFFLEAGGASLGHFLSRHFPLR